MPLTNVQSARLHKLVASWRMLNVSLIAEQLGVPEEDILASCKLNRATVRRVSGRSIIVGFRPKMKLNPGRD